MGLEVFSFFPISGHSWAFGRSKTCPHLNFGQDQPFDPFSAILRTFAKSGIKPTFATSDQIQVLHQTHLMKVHQMGLDVGVGVVKSCGTSHVSVDDDFALEGSLS